MHFFFVFLFIQSIFDGIKILYLFFKAQYNELKKNI